MGGPVQVSDVNVSHVCPELNRVYCADCVAFMSRLPKEFIDLIIADPPYNIGYTYDIYQDNRPDEEYLSWTEAWLNAAASLLKPTGALWVAIGDEYAAEVKWLATRKLGLHLRSWVVWYYTFGVLCGNKFSRSHTHLLYFVKDPKMCKFYADRIRVPSARRLVYNDRRTNPVGRTAENTWIFRPHVENESSLDLDGRLGFQENVWFLRPQDVPQGFRPLHDTWYFPRVAGTFKERAHLVPCQLPERLLGRIIVACSDPEDLVFDPFVGSGSTLVVAKKLGRRWFGCEISPNYANFAEQRIRLCKPGDPLEGPEDPLTSSPPTPMYFPGVCLSQEEREELEEKIVACFREAHQGYSLDRLLADPVLQAQFIDACSRHRLPGGPRDWNLTLLKLRKNKRLTVRTTSKGRISWDDLDDSILYAAEIALRKLLDQGYPSLDYVLADPIAALRFDEYARRIATGYESFYYRWAALMLRKKAKRLRRRCSMRNIDHREFRMLPLEADIKKNLPSAPGIFYLWQRLGKNDSPFSVYVGQARNLATTIAKLMETKERIAALCRRPGDLDIRYCSGLKSVEIGALQYYYASKDKPELNYLGVKDTEESG